MRKSQIALGERWKKHFRASRFQNFMREHAPRPPLAARASCARVPRNLYYPCYGTEYSLNSDTNPQSNLLKVFGVSLEMSSDPKRYFGFYIRRIYRAYVCRRICWVSRVSAA